MKTKLFTFAFWKDVLMLINNKLWNKMKKIIILTEINVIWQFWTWKYLEIISSRTLCIRQLYVFLRMTLKEVTLNSSSQEIIIFFRHVHWRIPFLTSTIFLGWLTQSWHLRASYIRQLRLVLRFLESPLESLF